LREGLRRAVQARRFGGREGARRTDGGDAGPVLGRSQRDVQRSVWVSLVDRDAQGRSLAPGDGAAAEGVDEAVRAAAGPQLEARGPLPGKPPHSGESGWSFSTNRSPGGSRRWCARKPLSGAAPRL